MSSEDKHQIETSTDALRSLIASLPDGGSKTAIVTEFEKLRAALSAKGYTLQR